MWVDVSQSEQELEEKQKSAEEIKPKPQKKIMVKKQPEKKTAKDKKKADKKKKNSNKKNAAKKDTGAAGDKNKTAKGEWDNHRCKGGLLAEWEITTLVRFMIW